MGGVVEMTKHEAEDLVEDFAQACAEYEHAEGAYVRRARQAYYTAKAKLIAALATPSTKGK